MSLEVLALTSIRPNVVALRGVDRESEQYLGLVESIRLKGFFGAITVRPQRDGETGEDYYEVIDGLHRFTAAQDAGLSEIKADIVEMSSSEVLEAQLMANEHKVDTKPMEYTKQILRILNENPLMTEAELAAKLGKSTQWLSQRLSLGKIANEKIQGLINEGKINLSNAYALAKLPPEEQVNFVDMAMTLEPKEFIPKATERGKEIRDANRKGKDAEEAVFTPVAHLQKMADIKAEHESGQIAKALCEGLGSAEEGFAMGVAWALHLDPQSVEVQRAKDDERKRLAAEKKKEKELEKARKKAEKAAKAKAEADEAQAALEG